MCVGYPAVVSTPYGRVIIIRHVLILHMNTPPIHDRHAVDFLHNQRFLSLLVLPCCTGLTAPATGRCLPETEAYTNQDDMHRYL